MPERVFTIFQGPDAGRTFVLGDQPVTLGREDGRDVVLHDDRASRLHARLLPDGDGAIVTDGGSSNGTFVNGELVRERKILRGDVVTIGANSIVFGREAPSARRLEKIAVRGAKPVKGAPGETTHILRDPIPDLELKRVSTHVGELVAEVADAARPAAAARAIHIAVETELEPDTALLDPQQTYRALAGLLAHFLEMWPAAPERPKGASAAATLALRLGPDPSRGGFQLEMICIGMAVPRDRIIARGDADALAAARRVTTAHGGALELLPRDSPDTLVRIRMPLGPTTEPMTMILAPK